MSDNQSFSYVIVGAGSAGCVLAARLSENPKNSVCLLEAGPPDRNPWIHVPIGYAKLFKNKKLNWMYQTKSDDGWVQRSIVAPRGKVLGGSSSINGMIYIRGQKQDYDVWRQLGNKGWSYDDILPYFCRFETYKSGGDLAYRGQNGEMTITDLDWRDPLCEAYIEGANSLGIPRNPDYNGKAQEGISYLQRTVNGRTRMSAAKAFLNPAKKRPNLKVITNAHVTRLTLRGKQVTGVSYHKGGVRGKHLHLKAVKEVIISGGAINTPQLLQLSGIGPASLLQQLGIDVQHDLPGVGENLRDHYATRLTA